MKTKKLFFILSLLFTTIVYAGNEGGILQRTKSTKGKTSIYDYKGLNGGGLTIGFGGGFLSNTNFKNLAIGPSVTIVRGEEFAIGADAGLYYYVSNDNISSFRLPISFLARYYIFGDGEGIYPEANLGIDYYHFSTNGLIKLTGSSTNFAMGFGGGYKAGNIQIGGKLHLIFTDNGTAKTLLFNFIYFLGS